MDDKGQMMGGGGEDNFLTTAKSKERCALFLTRLILKYEANAGIEEGGGGQMIIAMFVLRIHAQARCI